MNLTTERKMTKHEHLAWYQDPRVWVLLLAFLMFFFTLIGEKYDKQRQKSVSIPTKTSAPLGATDKASGF